LPLAESRKRFLVPLWVLILLLPLPLLITLADQNFGKSLSVGCLRIGEDSGAGNFWEVLMGWLLMRGVACHRSRLGRGFAMTATT
jgi:hypothetical protein